MLGMAFFKSLIKEHGKAYFEPIGKALVASGLKKPNPMNPMHAWALRSALVPYGKWRLGEAVTPRAHPEFPGIPDRLAAHAKYAAAGLQRSRLEISDVMTKHQLKLADRQCRMAELSQRVQDLLVILATSVWAGHQSSELVQDAADILCQDLNRKLTGKRPTDAYYRAVTKLGEKIAEGGFEAISGLEAEPILMSYSQ